MESLLGKNIGKYKIKKEMLSDSTLVATSTSNESKIIIKSCGNDVTSFYKQEELSKLKQLEHRNISTPLDIIKHESHLLISYSYCEGGDIRQYVDRKGRLSEEEAREVLAQIVAGYKELHSKKLVHGNIKPTSLFLPSGNQLLIKLGDFGITRRSNDFTAPELLTGETKPSCRSDVWSIGAVLYYLLHGVPPSNKDPKLTLRKDLSADCIELLERTLQFNEKSRITFETMESAIFLIKTPILAKEEAKVLESAGKKFCYGNL